MLIVQSGARFERIIATSERSVFCYISFIAYMIFSDEYLHIPVLRERNTSKMLVWV